MVSKFIIVEMAFLITGSLLGEVAFQGLVQVNARLVRQANHHPQHVSQLVGQVQVIARLA